MASIELRSVSKAYPTGHALEGLDLEVRSGELLAVMGASGSGKTTLLRLIAGLESPTSGEVRIGGIDQRGVAPRDRSVAMVLQGLGLFGRMTVRENLHFGQALRSSKGSSLWQRWMGWRTNRQQMDAVQLVAEQLGIAGLLDKRPAELSGGEQQRLAIGRALLRRPAVFLLDEPLASLDGPTRIQLGRQIKQLQRQLGATTVYVTHDPSEAFALGDRVAVLSDGRLQQVGMPEEVFAQPANRCVARLVAGRATSFVRVALETLETDVGARLGGLVLPAPIGVAARLRELGCSEVCLGIRADGVVLDGADASSSVRAEPSGTAIVEEIEFQAEAIYARIRMRDEVNAAELELTAKVAAGVFHAGQQVGVQVRAEFVDWFDPATGVNLGGQSCGLRAK